jgi:hypothetical protein
MPRHLRSLRIRRRHELEMRRPPAIEHDPHARQIQERRRHDPDPDNNPGAFQKSAQH